MADTEYQFSVLIFLYILLNYISIRSTGVLGNSTTLEKKKNIRNANLNQIPLRKHTYSNVLKIIQPKKENFQIKFSDIFRISAQNLDCGYSLEPPRQGGSNEYQQSVLSRYKKNNVYPCKPVLLIKKKGGGGLRGSELYRHVFLIFVLVGFVYYFGYCFLVLFCHYAVVYL